MMKTLIWLVGLVLNLVLIGSNDDELAPVEDSRCGDENVC